VDAAANHQDCGQSDNGQILDAVDVDEKVVEVILRSPVPRRASFLDVSART